MQIASQLLGLDQISRPQLTAFIATIQLGTEAAVVIYFFKDIMRIALAWFGSLFSSSRQNERARADAKLGWLIIVGSLPVVVIGLVFKNQIENQLRNLWVIAFTLIIFGIVLAVADKFGKRTKAIDKISTRDGLLFGFAQALAVIPGVSRSGGTISMGLFLGYSRQAAARYSFLLASPAVVASGTFEFATTYQQLAPSDLAATVIATLVSFGVGYTVIVALLRYLNRGSFLPFGIWRIAVGLALLALLSAGALVA